MSKGQIAGQIFIYIMAVIVVGAIALIGYSAIKNVVSKSCDAEKITFVSDLDSYIEKFTSYGSVNKKTIVAPCDYETICFVDGTKTSLEQQDRNIQDCTNNIIKESVSSGANQNIFVISKDKTLGVGYNSLISLPSFQQNNCTCIKQRNNNFYITFEGKGSSVEIKE